MVFSKCLLSFKYSALLFQYTSNHMSKDFCRHRVERKYLVELQQSVIYFESVALVSRRLEFVASWKGPRRPIIFIRSWKWGTNRQLFCYLVGVHDYFCAGNVRFIFAVDDDWNSWVACDRVESVYGNMMSKYTNVCFLQAPSVPPVRTDRQTNSLLSGPGATCERVFWESFSNFLLFLFVHF